MKDYLTLTETFEKWGISTLRINTLCVKGRIPDAIKLANMWVIPADATKPKDARIRSGAYVKNKKD